MAIIFFDIDDTLMTTSGASKRAMNSAFLEIVHQPLNVDGLNLGGRTDAGIIAELARNLSVDLSVKDRDRILDCYLEHLETELQLSGGSLLPGATEVLALLAADASCDLGVITGNSRRGADLKLACHGIERYFSFGGYGDAHEHRDDVAVDGLKSAHEALGNGAQSRALWVVGDTPHDITCAAAIGARCIAVATGHFSVDALSAHHPHAVVESLFAVPDLINSNRMD